MVCPTEYPNFRPASCCKVEVVNGADGDFFAGFVSNPVMVKMAAIHLFKKASASSMVFNFFCNSAFKRPFRSVKNTAETLNEETGTKFTISRSLSTIKRTVILCTLPADKDGLTFFHKIGDNSYPTNLSKTLRACWASTKCLSMVRGLSMAFKMAFLVISE